jgi:Xaa-Pro aminopeptidase
VPSTASKHTPMDRQLGVHESRVNAPISTAELERRWTAVRAAMEDARIDALFVHSHVDGIGGATRWFADLPAGGGYPTSLVFPLREPMTLVAHGPRGGDREIPSGDPALRGIGRLLTTASFASVVYCQEYDSDLVLQALRPLTPSRVGLVHPGTMPYPMVDAIRRGLSDAEVVDASDLVDSIKAVKSTEELAAIRATATMQDEALAYGFAIVEPGMRDSQITAAVQHFCAERGSESGVYMAGSAAPGEPAMFQLRHNQERVIGEGDYFTLQVENSGAGGFYSHLGRTARLGEVPQSVLEDFELARAAQQVCVDMFTPGVRASDIFAAYNDFLLSHGRPPERRLHCHAQGYDVVERPLIGAEETMSLEAGMHIGCHPMWLHNDVFTFLCDNYFVNASGPAERIHATAQQFLSL